MFWVDEATKYWSDHNVPAPVGCQIETPRVLYRKWESRNKGSRVTLVFGDCLEYVHPEPEADPTEKTVL